MDEHKDHDVHPHTHTWQPRDFSKGRCSGEWWCWTCHVWFTTGKKCKLRPEYRDHQDDDRSGERDLFLEQVVVIHSEGNTCYQAAEGNRSP